VSPTIATSGDKTVPREKVAWKALLIVYRNLRPLSPAQQLDERGNDMFAN
jgi:hypothetical protein